VSSAISLRVPPQCGHTSTAQPLQSFAIGRILNSPCGERDFGYDPCFLFTEDGFPRTNKGFAEMTPDEKSRVSPRGRALREFARRLPVVLQKG
jgi:XTP/dITP diphosphohydrolase